MEGKKENVIDLRKIKRKPDELAPKNLPVVEEKTPSTKRKVGIVPLLAIGFIDIALIVYFALSNNYLASFFFFLAAIVGAFRLFKKTSRERP